MPRKPGPTARRWQLGTELQGYRLAANVSAKDAAAEIEVTAATLSKIEGGRQAIKPPYVKLLALKYGVSEETRGELIQLAQEANQPGYWVPFSKIVPDWFKLLLGYERDATRLCAYESELVPGLLQIPEYIVALLRINNPDASAEWMEKQLELRQLRQKLLTEPDPPAFRVVLNEAVLLRMVGGREVMARQLRHLANIAEHQADIEDDAEIGGLVVQVLPFAAGEHPAMTAPFLLLGFDYEPRMDTVYLENGRGALYLDKRADLDSYTAKFKQLTRMALTPKDSLSHLVTLVRNL